MPTAKARYTGRETGSKPNSLSEDVKHALRELHSQFTEEVDERSPDWDAAGPEVPWGNRPHDFVNAINAEVHWAFAELQEHGRDLTKSEMWAEHDDFLRSLRAAREAARDRSPDYSRLFPTDVDLVSQLDDMISTVEAAGLKITQAPKAGKPADKQHAVAVEMAIRVLRVVKQYRIPVTATADVDLGRASPAVRILKLIGDDLKLVLSIATWLKVVIAAKHSAPDVVK
ncbi:hypothetical protein OKW43_002952 [Paraburkholderia sp. WC7.3g]|uniref:hypothetical protein n=1 Tax=Paraburkholderia sp. WC7.3g TaxID=2991070 RepID=UPI003D1A75DB